MDLISFKKEYVIKREGGLGIDASYGRVLTVIDFGNVNYWFDEDRQDAEDKLLPNDEKLSIEISKLKEFCSLFSDHVRFYYGHDPQNPKSLAFIAATRYLFGKYRVFTKPVQKIRHHLDASEIELNTRVTHVDSEGVYVNLPKCNFDVEIAVDAIRLAQDKEYDTLALFSSDSDFVSLARFLRKNKGYKKKVILFKGGRITSSLREEVDLVVNAQRIKTHITKIEKQKPGDKPGLAK